AGEALWLPDPKDGTGGIGEHGHAADVHYVHRLDDHVAPCRLDLLGDIIGVGDAHIGRPRGRLARLHMAHEARDVLPILLKHAVAATLGRTRLGRAPAHDVA